MLLALPWLDQWHQQPHQSRHWRIRVDVHGLDGRRRVCLRQEQRWSRWQWPATQWLHKYGEHPCLPGMSYHETEMIIFERALYSSSTSWNSLSTQLSLWAIASLASPLRVTWLALRQSSSPPWPMLQPFARWMPSSLLMARLTLIARHWLTRPMEMHLCHTDLFKPGSLRPRKSCKECTRLLWNDKKSQLAT